VILYRCFAWDERARYDQQDGPLWFPRVFQGEGRHDNPDLYGCMYLADRSISSVVEQLARFRGQRLTESLLRRRGLPLALAEIELAKEAKVINLDDPSTLTREALRPSMVATRQREVTQPQARKLHDGHTEAAGLSWWSTYESLWMNVTIFERAAAMLRVHSIRSLRLEDPAVVEAAHFFEFRVG
jgi:hypothetical protein